MSASWEQFVSDFDDAVFACSEKGQQTRLQIGFDGDPHVVTVDIYPQGGTMKKFNDAILAVAKESSGFKVKK